MDQMVPGAYEDQAAVEGAHLWDSSHPCLCGPWAYHLTSPGLDFLIHKMDMIVLLPGLLQKVNAVANTRGLALSRQTSSPEEPSGSCPH